MKRRNSEPKTMVCCPLCGSVIDYIDKAKAKECIKKIRETIAKATK